MAKGWYVVHTYSGYENKVEKYIRKMMENGDLEDAVFDVKVPSEEVVEMRDGKKTDLPQKNSCPATFLWRWTFPTEDGKTCLQPDTENPGRYRFCRRLRQCKTPAYFVG